jgi:hypothetical protein
MDHWTDAAFPGPTGAAPFPWHADRSRAIADDWLRQLIQHAATLGPLLACYFATAASPPVPQRRSRLIRVKLTGKLNDEPEFAAVLLAYGAGREACTITSSPEFVSYRFWDTDPFELQRSGLSASRERTVLISGTGDGALQDLLRLLTRLRSVRKVWEALDLHKAPIDLNALNSADRRATRAGVWQAYGPGASRAFVQPYVRKLHEVCEKEVDRILTEELRPRIMGLIQGRPAKTFLVASDKCFTCTYVFNRFLALLLLKAIKTHSDPDMVKSVEMLAPHQLEKIDDMEVMPLPDPTEARHCLGRHWQVTLRDQQTGTDRTENPYVILVRHGLEKMPVPTPQRALPSVPRPMPPTHLH